MAHRVVYTRPYDDEVEYLESSGTIRRVFRFGNKRFIMPMPYDSKVEYLESPSGNAYINTLIPANKISEFTVRIAPTTVPSTFYALGADAGGNTRFSVGYSTTDNGLIQVRLGEYYNAINYTLFQFDTITLNRLTGKYYINGTEYTGKIVTNSKTNPNSFILFRARSNSSLYSQKNTARIASFSAKGLNGELVLDLIPVRRGNVEYMYDKISGKLFGNAGTRQFILGNDIND